MLQALHARDKVSGIQTDSRAIVAAVSAGRVVALRPLDSLPGIAETNKAVVQIATRSRQELKAARLEITLTGRASGRASTEIPTAGWTVVPVRTTP